jgi:hypothetical protein
MAADIDYWKHENQLVLQCAAGRGADRVILEPLRDDHFPAIFEVGGQDPDIGRFYPASVPLVYDSAEHMKDFFHVR